MKGFFPEATFHTASEFSNTPKCGECGLYKKCISKKMAPQGQGERKILIVLPPVNSIEDEKGKFLKGELSVALKEVLLQNRFSPLTDCWITSALICHTGQPTMEQIDFCSYKLRETIETLQPYLVIPIGDHAVRSIAQFTWKKIPEKPHLFFGYHIPSTVLNAWICPVFLPDYTAKNVPTVFFKEQLESALDYSERPYETIPNWENQVTLLWKESDIEKALNPWFTEPFAAGFDYETNCLKPDMLERSRIVCAALCFNGRVTYAFPWLANVPSILKRLTRNKQGWFIGSNIKYEQRWSKARLGFSIRHWLWDTMLSAHAMDNRGGKDPGSNTFQGGGLSSLKVQSYLHHGVPVYDDHIKPYLSSEGSYTLNRITEIPLKELLTYNGLDALYSYMVAKSQTEKMGHPARKKMK